MVDRIARATSRLLFEDLVKINGVVAAGEFRIDGTLVDYRATMNMSPEPATSAAQFLRDGQHAVQPPATGL